MLNQRIDVILLCACAPVVLLVLFTDTLPEETRTFPE